MSKISDRIRAHAQSIERRPLAIPEWGITCYLHPLTVEDRNAQMKLAQSDPYLSFLEVICAACRDENGRRVFDVQDKMTMKKEGHPSVIERIALEILKPYLEMDTGAGETGAGAAATE